MQHNFLSLSSLRFTLFLILILRGGNSPLSAAIPLEYNRDIRPILAEYCFACHGADSAARKADLRLDQREAAIELEAIVVGKPDKSELIARIFANDPELLMPPPETKKKLTEKEKAILRRWIAEGAEYQPHWSFIAPQKPALPEVKQTTWLKNEIDRFILAKLEPQGLTPAPEADAHTLFRRLHLDITGLPPKPHDTASFVKDYAGNPDRTLSTWIDKLMQSTAWGEHRARYWLDAARYGDTHGLHFDNYREMWPYRDWVIRAFNANQPFDQFTMEQLAGDLLPKPTEAQLIATGFQRCNITTNEGGTIDEENLANYAADRVQTFGWVYLGLTTNCGQCHDHKFDPFTMKDYYSLAAFFRNTTQGPKDGNKKDGRGPVIVVPSAQDKPRWKALPAEIAAAQQQRDAHRKTARKNYDHWLATVDVDTFNQSLPQQNLLIHLPLNEGSGNTIHNLTSAADTFTTDHEVSWIQDGKFGPAPAIKPNSTFDLGGLGDFEFDQKFSYGAWIKSGSKNVAGGIIARMDVKNAYRGWDLFQNNLAVSVHLIDTWNQNAIKVRTRANVLKPGQWQHVFATYDGSAKPGGIKIYVDGKSVPLVVEVNTLKPNASLQTETPLRVGQRSDAQYFTGGAIQDVRIYSRLLTAEEVTALARHVGFIALLKTEPDKRTAAQKNQLFDHYLNHIDARYSALIAAITNLQAEQTAIKNRSPVTHIQKERRDKPAMAHILMRGAYDKPGDQVTATTPAALHSMPKNVPSNRLGLAHWLVDEANPLTARVTVNRFWQEVFGRGIVATPEDFGVMGALPTHPELLDWLAIKFRQQGWDVKKFFKRIFMSATYRQAAIITTEKLEKDRDNSLLSRGPRFRMDAEMVRDYMLAASGLLSPKMYGPGVKPYQPSDIWSIVGLPGGDTRNYVQDKGDNLYRRTIYSFWKRMAHPPNMEAFNAPSREVCTVQRERTNTPLQALVTLNDPQFVEAARNLAQLAMLNSSGKDDQILEAISLRVLNRVLNQQEQQILFRSKAKFLTYYQATPDAAKALIAVGESPADASLNVSQLAAWTMVCNQVLNLDEALNK